MQALLHASVACNHKLIVDWVPARDLEDDTLKEVITDFFLHKLVNCSVLLYSKPLMINLLLSES